MARTIWYFIQLCALIGSGLWLLGQRGVFSLALGDYTVQGQSGLLAFMLFFVIVFLLALHRFWMWIVRLPARIATTRREGKLHAGHQALTRSLSAIGAGNYSTAYKEAHRAKKLLPDFPAVPAILIATSAAKQGLSSESDAAFKALLKTDARDLGARGLVNKSLATGDLSGGLSTARAALSQTPKHAGLARLVYDLECKNGDWEMALSRHKFLVKHQALIPDQARQDAAKLSCMIARDLVSAGHHKQALKIARSAWSITPEFIPLACDLIDLYRGFGDIRRARKILIKTYTLVPHPDLITRYEQMAPEKGSFNKRIAYYKKLLALAPDDPYGLLMMARIYQQEQHIASAKEYLDRAIDIAPSRDVYRARADFNTAHGNRLQAQADLERGMSAMPPPTWMCAITGKTFDSWVPVIKPDYLFGTITWGTARTVISTPAFNLLAS